MTEHDVNLLKKIEKIKDLLDQNKAKFRSADQVSKQTYDYLKEKLTLDSGSCVDLNLSAPPSRKHQAECWLFSLSVPQNVSPGNNNNYYVLAQNLRRSITEMKIKIDSQLRILAALKDRVKDQVTQMQRLEVSLRLRILGEFCGLGQNQVSG